MDFAGNASLTRSAALSGEFKPATNRTRAKLIVGASDCNFLITKLLEINIPRFKAVGLQTRRLEVDSPFPTFRPCRHPGENRGPSHPLNLDTVFQRYDGRCPPPGYPPEFILSHVFRQRR